jgi:hypothetical protein
MNFCIDICGFARDVENIPFGRQPFCTLALLAVGRGARTAASRRRASLQSDLPLGVPAVFNRLLRRLPCPEAFAGLEGTREATFCGGIQTSL